MRPSRRSAKIGRTVLCEGAVASFRAVPDASQLLLKQETTPIYSMREPEESISPATYWLTRALFLRWLGCIYFVAFLSLFTQLPGLLLQGGLLPIDLHLDSMQRYLGGKSFLRVPTIFWLDCSDDTLLWAAFCGLTLSALVAIGRANGAILFTLWGIYLSFVNVGQIFYGYGWESLLLESGFLAIFMRPCLRTREHDERFPPLPLLAWLPRWLLFRVMFGAGLIKLRSGEPCWLDLTCMLYHYETQPLPNPASWYLHHMPAFVHKLGTLVNHFVELVVPWMFFGTRRIRAAGGIFTILFQAMLIASGNLSWLNWLTIGLCLWCFDDGALTVPFERFAGGLKGRRDLPARRIQLISSGVLVALVVVLSVPPALNLISPNQLMNASFEPFHLVNTYGAFGSIGKQRFEVILEGTASPLPYDDAEWKPYELPCKPGRVDRRPCVIAPYQYRLDWQIWFAAMQSPADNPWLIHLIAKLLTNDPAALALLGENPFPHAPPRWIRARLARYRFSGLSDQSGAWWTAEPAGVYLNPVSLETPSFRRYLEDNAWLKRLRRGAGDAPGDAANPRYSDAESSKALEVTHS